jgi:hypothetical protein
VKAATAVPAAHAAAAKAAVVTAVAVAATVARVAKAAVAAAVVTAAVVPVATAAIVVRAAKVAIARPAMAAATTTALRPNSHRRSSRKPATDPRLRLRRKRGSAAMPGPFFRDHDFSHSGPLAACALLEENHTARTERRPHRTPSSLTQTDTPTRYDEQGLDGAYRPANLTDHK